MSNSASKKQQVFIRDAVHKNIDISELVIQELVNSKEFQRLRWISQLGGAQIAFPSATHTRYTHSLGVYHILTRVLNQVKGNDMVSDKEKLIIRIAGLLHDIGHGPFSHTFEKITNFNDNSKFKFNHEWYTCAIINDETSEINQILKKYKINTNQIINIINKNEKECPKYQIQLVSSQLDCDRMDYLMRDGYFTGVDYGAIDLDWVISNMIIDQEKGIIFNYKAVAAIENYLITRFHMYSQVYYHKSSILFDAKLQALFSYLKKLEQENYQWTVDLSIFKTILNQESIVIKDYLLLIDATIINFLNDIIILESDKMLISLAQSILLLKDKQWELNFQPWDNKNNKENIKVLKNVIYNLKKEPILIKINDHKILPLEKVSQILQNPTQEQLIAYTLKLI